MTFAEYMESALYGPGGYYATEAGQSGRAGDYFTAPDVGPVFGRLLTSIFRHWADAFDARPFHLVEAGAGMGRLAQSIGMSLVKDFPQLAVNIDYTAVERSAWRRAALERLKMPCSFHVEPDLCRLAQQPVDGCLFANELIDAFPVHRVRVREAQLEEGFVDLAGDGESRKASWHWQAPSTLALSPYFHRLGIELPDGYETEVNLQMSRWLKDAARALRSGFVVLIDYGRPADEYYHPDRAQGTLRGFRAHEVRREVLATGIMDITADVDFTSLALDAMEAGLTPMAFMTLGSFLSWGARLWPPEIKSEWSGFRYLVHPEGMGSAFHVLILGKGIDPADWTFEGNRLKSLGLIR